MPDGEKIYRPNLISKDLDRYMRISEVPFFDDNYSYIVTNKDSGVIVDPGDADAVWDFLTREHMLREFEKYKINHVFLTHKHADHVINILRNFDISLYEGRRGETTDINAEGT